MVYPMSPQLDLTQMLNSAMDLHRQGHLAAAEKAYRRILVLNAKHPDALHLLGVIRGDLGFLDEGIALIQQALRLLPTMSDAHYNLGNFQRKRGDMEAAARHFQKAVKLQPANINALSNLSATLMKLRRYDEAEVCLKRALERDPNLVPAKLNLAALHEIRGRFDETIATYNDILNRTPNDIEARYMRALALLRRGQFVDGWTELRCRFLRPDTQGFHGQFPFPYWNGEALADKGIMVWAEQGLGDELLIGTMMPDMIRKARTVVLLCSERMAPLFATAFPQITVMAADDKPKDGALLANVEFQASLSELGRWLRPDFPSFSPMRGYLNVDAGLAAGLRHAYLQDRPGPRLIGVSWRSRNPDVEVEKSMSLATLGDVLKMPGCTFVSLQYGDCAAEIAETNRKLGTTVIHDPSVDATRDLARFAAQVEAMDLVISVSNTTVHMGGALGKETWAMIPADRGRMWYWFLNRDDSPWYDSVKLFRGTLEKGWAPAIDGIAAALAKSQSGDLVS